jgi:hypothetical protein
MRKKGKTYKPKKDIAKYKKLNDVFRGSDVNHEIRKSKRLYWKDKDLD